jgi:hypothetical protein
MLTISPTFTDTKSKIDKLYNLRWNTCDGICNYYGPPPSLHALHALQRSRYRVQTKPLPTLYFETVVE